MLKKNNTHTHTFTHHVYFLKKKPIASAGVYDSVALSTRDSSNLYTQPAEPQSNYTPAPAEMMPPAFDPTLDHGDDAYQNLPTDPNAFNNNAFSSPGVDQSC